MARPLNSADYGAKTKAAHPRGIEQFSPEGVFAALHPWLREGVVYIEDDFIEDTISSTRWNLSADGTATTYAWSSGLGGRLAGATGTTDNGYHAINGDVIWSGDKNAGCEIRWQVDVVTGFSFEFGFTDALADETLPAVTDVDTPATGNGATDVAVIHLDTDQTLTTAAFVSESTGSTFACQKVNIGTFTPTAAKWYRMRVQLNGNNASYKIWYDEDAQNPYLIASGEGSLTSALEGGTLVRPHFLIGTRNTTDKASLIDYIRVWQDR
jgi:hypothetical protein